MITIERHKKGDGSKLTRQGFSLPVFCPEPGCLNHSTQGRSPRKGWYRLRGVLHTKRHGEVQLYMCRDCGRSFSESSFKVSYYEKVKASCQDILALATPEITLGVWAARAGLSQGVLKLRLCKLGVLLLRRLKQQGLEMAAFSLAFQLEAYRRKGARPYHLLRALIVALKTVVTLVEKTVAGEPGTCDRVFDRELTENVYRTLKIWYCTWRYPNGFPMFHYPQHQWE